MLVPTEAEPVRVVCGDALDVLQGLPADSIHCCVTSPPYYGLRDYGMSGQIGLEPTPGEYVARLVSVFREVRRVLRPDGTLWLNLGDSYAANVSGGMTGSTLSKGGRQTPHSRPAGQRPRGAAKHKDLLGIPWMVAFALRADGWYLRQDIIWAKPNPMPESVRDRCTKAHEYVFLLSKSPRYYYDAEAVRRPLSEVSQEMIRKYERDGVRDGQRAKAFIPGQRNHTGGTGGVGRGSRGACMNPNGANLRSVWSITPKPYKGAHFATFPPKLIEPCILAGTSAEGVCPKCGAPWTRQVSRKRVPTRPGADTKVTGVAMTDGNRDPLRHVTAVETTGWQPGCKCDAGPPVPAVVLDPFMGSGTVAAVALENGRRAVGCELNPDYIKLIHDRLAMVTPNLFTGLEG